MGVEDDRGHLLVRLGASHSAVLRDVAAAGRTDAGNGGRLSDSHAVRRTACPPPKPKPRPRQRRRSKNQEEAVEVDVKVTVMAYARGCPGPGPDRRPNIAAHPVVYSPVPHMTTFTGRTAAVRARLVGDPSDMVVASGLARNAHAQRGRDTYGN